MIPHKSNNLRFLVANVNSISSKSAELINLVDSTEPDVILMSETKLKSTILSSEFTPPGYKCFRKDRNSRGGGVLVMLKDHFIAEEVDISEDTGEVIWVKIKLKGEHPLYVSSFYRSPSVHSTEQLDKFERSLDHIKNLTKNNPSATVITGGDFNTRGVDWTNLNAAPGTPDRSLCLRLLEILSNHLLSQMNIEPTRESTILDLFITNKPGLLKACTVIPGLSDHEIVLADCDIKAASVRKEPRSIFRWNKADWVKSKKH